MKLWKLKFKNITEDQIELFDLGLDKPEFNSGEVFEVATYIDDNIQAYIVELHVVIAGQKKIVKSWDGLPFVYWCDQKTEFELNSFEIRQRVKKHPEGIKRVPKNSKVYLGSFDINNIIEEDI